MVRRGGHPSQPLALIYTDFLQSGKQEMRKSNRGFLRSCVPAFTCSVALVCAVSAEFS